MSDELTYASYLKVGTILQCQNKRSDEPDELLFMLTHQAFELWFKEVLGDIDRVCAILEKNQEDKEMEVINLLQRIVMIFKLVVQQFSILETMPPAVFMRFRAKLKPASGFQSLQFRMIEIRLGIDNDKRAKSEDKPYTHFFTPEENKKMDEARAKTSLLKTVEGWLEKIPGELSRDVEPHIVSKEDYEKPSEAPGGERGFKQTHRLSYEAFKGAFLVTQFQHLPRFAQKGSIVKLLMDVEEAIWMWRSNHVMMVHRMIGDKVGTSGSAGIHYLLKTLSWENYRIFTDLFSVSSHLKEPGEVSDLADRIEAM